MFVTLTISNSTQKVTINANHIIDFWRSTDPVTIITLASKNSNGTNTTRYVNETPEQILAAIDAASA